MKRSISTFILMALLVLSFHMSARAQSETPSAPPVGSWKGTITGKVINRTPGANVPASVDLVLHGWDPEGNEKLMLHGKSNADGTYRFSEVDFKAGIQVAVMSSYQDAAYYSDPVDIQPGQKSLDMTVPIYEIRNDLASTSIEAMHVLFYFEAQDLVVTEVYVLGNLGDRTVKDVIDLPRDRKGTLKFPLPEGAKNVTFDTQETDRFILLPDGFADTAPLPPGSRSAQVVVKFNLPYQNKLDFQFQPPVAVDSVNLLVPQDSGLSIQGNGIASQAVQNMQGTDYAVYTGQALKADEQFNLALSGKPKLSEAGEAGQTDNKQVLKTTNSNLAYGAGAFGLALIFAGFLWWRKSGSVDDEEDEELDDDHELGEGEDSLIR